MNNVDSVIGSYTESAIAHGEATMQGDNKLANKSYDEIISCAKQLRALGNSGRDELEKLLKHSNDSVRLWAATHSLRDNEIKAKSALNALAKSNGILSFSAEMVLTEWDGGRLETP